MAMAACTSMRTLQPKAKNFSPFLHVNGGISRNGVLGFCRGGGSRYSMFLKTAAVVRNGVLSFNGAEALVAVPDNVVITPSSESSVFLGSTSSESTSRHVFKLGVIE